MGKSLPVTSHGCHPLFWETASSRQELSCFQMRHRCRHGHDVGALAIWGSNLSQIRTDFNQRQLALKTGPQIGFHLYFGWPNLDTSLLFGSLSYPAAVPAASELRAGKGSWRTSLPLLLDVWTWESSPRGWWGHDVWALCPLESFPMDSVTSRHLS